MKKTVETNENSSTEHFELENFLPYKLSVAAEIVSRLMARDHLAEAGLTMPEWRLIAVVGRFGVLSPTAAGACTTMDKVKVSRAAASLVARGLLRQAHDPADGRGRLLRLTRKGSAAYADLIQAADAIEATLMESLTKAERGVLHRALGKLSAHAFTLLQLNGVDADE